MSDVKRDPFHDHEVDAATLKAFAHPLRMRMYTYLNDHGAATASMRAEAMGESSGQTSYHLRQLARHGLIVEDVGRGTARERWWQSPGMSFGLATTDAYPTAWTAMELVQRQGVEDRRRRQHEWIDRQSTEDRDWQEVVTFNETTTRLTPEELGGIVAAFAEVLGEHLARARTRRAADGNAGTRMVKVYSQMFPLPPD